MAETSRAGRQFCLCWSVVGVVDDRSSNLMMVEEREKSSRQTGHREPTSLAGIQGLGETELHSLETLSEHRGDVPFAESEIIEKPRDFGISHIQIM